MGILEVYTGGSASGKSDLAQQRIAELHEGSSAPLFYLASMKPGGQETAEKIAAHKRSRAGMHFQTLEWQTGIRKKVLQTPELKGAYVLLEDVSNLLANELYDEAGAAAKFRKDFPDIADAYVYRKVTEEICLSIRVLKGKCACLIAVTNDVFAESVPDSEEMRQYKKSLGEINRYLAEEADRVIEAVYGIPHILAEKEKLSSKGPVAIEENHSSGQEKGGDAEGVESAAAMEGKVHSAGREEGGDAKGAGGGTARKGEESPAGQAEEKPGLHLIVGGAFQGKHEFARLLYPGLVWGEGATLSFAELGNIGVLTDFQMFLRRWLLAGNSWEALADEIVRKAPGLVILCDEVGCGLVPVDAFERKYREAVGKCMTRLAKQAKRVDRVCLGTASRLL